MEKRVITCTECPNGCQVAVSLEKGNIVEIKGNACSKGRVYAENEIVNPRRVLTTTVKVVGGGVISVKTDRAIQKANIFKVMEKANTAEVTRPKSIGDIVIENIDEDINLVITRSLR